MKRSDVPEVDVLRAYRNYRSDLNAVLASVGAQSLPDQVTAMMRPGFPRVARPVERLAFPYKVAMARVMQLVDSGLIEYGVSPDVGWLTDKGKLRLSELEEAS